MSSGKPKSEASRKAESPRRALQAAKKSPARAEKSGKRGTASGTRKGGTAQKSAAARKEHRVGAFGKAVIYFLVFCAVCGVLGASAILAVSGAMVKSSAPRVLTADEAADLSDVDCILVLGCGVYADGTPSPMLADRVRTGIDLYLAGASERLLMSGDHGQDDYDEVNTMKRLAVESGLDPDVVFCDHAGFSTWDSMVRAKKIFGAKKIVIVTQEYHLYRALYMAKKLGMDAYGVSADLRDYGGQWMRDLREVGARFKGFFSALLDLPPKYLGDPIPLDGPGSQTDG